MISSDCNPLILHTSPTVDQIIGGGLTNAVVSLLTEIYAQGFDARLFSTLVSQQTISVVGKDSFPFPCEMVKSYIFRKMRFSVAPSFKRSLYDYCTRNSVSILHNNSLWMPVNHHTSIVARKLNIPIVSSPHGTLSKWALNHRAIKKKIALFLYQQRDLELTTMFHATSEEELMCIRGLGLHQPVVLVPNGVDLPPWKNRSKKHNNAIRTVLFMSRIHPSKGVEKLIEAWDRIKPNNWHCIIAGPDELGHRLQLEKLVQSKNLTDFFQFIGFVSGKEKAELFRKSDIFVLPTESENFGIVVAEALAFGLPVLTTTGAPWSDLIKYNCGWWKEINIDSFTEGLKEAMFCSDEQRVAMGLRGRLLIEKAYSWKLSAKMMIEAYLWLLGVGLKPDFVICD